MEIIKKVSTHNTSAKPQRSINYIVIHYTAGTTSKKGTALNTANYFAKSKVSASADFIVDDAQIVQYNPDLRNRYCWAVGSSKGKLKSKAGASLYGKATNSNCVSIEICSNLKKGYVYAKTLPNSDGWYFTKESLENALALTKYLMKELNIPKERVIRHYDVTGKCCPGIIGWNEDTISTWSWNNFKSKL